MPSLRVQLSQVVREQPVKPNLAFLKIKNHCWNLHSLSLLNQSVQYQGSYLTFACDFRESLALSHFMLESSIIT